MLEHRVTFITIGGYLCSLKYIKIQGVFSLLQEARQFSQGFKASHDLSLKKGAYYQGCLPGRGDSVLECSCIKIGVVLQCLAGICASVGIHTCPRCLNSTAAVTTRLHYLKCWKLCFCWPEWKN